MRSALSGRIADMISLNHMREDIDTNLFKNKLEEELTLVEKQLNEVGRINPDN